MSVARCPKCRIPLDTGMLGGLCPRCVSAIVWQDDAAEHTRIGPYELEEEIASGGNGVVFRARHAEMDRTVALKLLRAGPLATAAELARFRAEVEALSRFGHPNLVPVYEVGRQDGRPWFAMPWYPGGALKISRPWPAEESAAIMVKVSRAVHHAHAHGVLHRDIKPGNILIDEGGEPHVADFGLAKWLDTPSAGDMTLAGSALGTPGYMAPEQAAGDPGRVAVAADVFGLGAVLYHLLTGRPPFTGDTTLEVIRHTVESEPPRPSSLAPGLDRDLETICLKALEKNPAARYSSALALAEDLERRLQHIPVLARRSGTLERLKKWRRRRPAVAALTALALLIFAAGVSGIAWQWRRATALAAESKEFAEGESAARATAEQRELAALRARYAADMNLCQEALATHNLARARRLLDAHRPQPGRPDLRGWEWRWLWQQCRSDAASVAGNTGGIIYSLALSPDGRRAVLVNRKEKEQTELWDMEKGVRMAVVNADARAGHVAFSPDGSFFASPASKSIQLSRASDGSVVHTLRMRATPRTLAFSEDGLLLGAIGSDGGVRVWDTGNRNVVCEFTIERINTGFGGALCFLHGQPPRLACGSHRGTVYIVSLEDGIVEREIAAHEKGNNCVTSLALSPDGSLLASAAAYDDFAIRVWNVATGEPAATLTGHLSWVARVAFLKDGSGLVSCGADHTLRLWDPLSGAPRVTLQGHLHEVWALGLTPDGSRMVTGDKNGTLLHWRPADLHRPAARFDFPKEVSLALAAGDHILTCNEDADSSMSVYSPREWREKRFPGVRGAGTFLHEGGVLAHWEGNTRVRLAEDLSDLRRITADITTPPAKPETEWIEDGWLVCIGQTGGLIAGDTANERKFSEMALPSGVLQGKPFLRPAVKQAFGWDTNGDLWRLSLADRRWQGPWKPPLRASRWTVNADGNWFAAATGRKVCLAATQTGGRCLSFSLRNPVQALALQRDGRWLAVSDELGNVRLWDGQAPERPPLELRGHLNAVHRLIFTPDGTRLVTLCSHAEAARFWAVPTGEELITLTGPPEILHAGFACEGDVLLVRSRAGWHAWRAPSVAEINAAAPDGGW